MAGDCRLTREVVNRIEQREGKGPPYPSADPQPSPRAGRPSLMVTRCESYSQAQALGVA